MTNGLANSMDWLSMASSFLLVIGLLAVVLYLLRRFQPGALGGGRQIQLIESLATGSRQRVVLVRVRDKDLLLGVSMQQINTLAEWPAPIDEQRPMLGGASAPSSAARVAARGDSAPLPVTQGLPKAVVPAAEALAKFLRKK
ncbi:MAG: flagellar biosynthetic protein FliO [Burkholderiaceae bacterium]|jgi:flagellar protein FliO/FliZ